MAWTVLRIWRTRWFELHECSNVVSTSCSSHTTSWTSEKFAPLKGKKDSLTNFQRNKGNLHQWILEPPSFLSSLIYVERRLSRVGARDLDEYSSFGLISRNEKSTANVDWRVRNGKSRVNNGLSRWGEVCREEKFAHQSDDNGKFLRPTSSSSVLCDESSKKKSSST